MESGDVARAAAIGLVLSDKNAAHLRTLSESTRWCNRSGYKAKKVSLYTGRGNEEGTLTRVPYKNGTGRGSGYRRQGTASRNPTIHEISSDEDSDEPEEQEEMDEPDDPAELEETDEPAEQHRPQPKPRRKVAPAAEGRRTPPSPTEVLPNKRARYRSPARSFTDEDNNAMVSRVVIR